MQPDTQRVVPSMSLADGWNATSSEMIISSRPRPLLGGLLLLAAIGAAVAAVVIVVVDPKGWPSWVPIAVGVAALVLLVVGVRTGRPRRSRSRSPFRFDGTSRRALSALERMHSKE